MTCHKPSLCRIYTVCNSVFDIWLASLFALVDMSKFKDGRVHFRNSGMKGLIAESDCPILCMAEVQNQHVLLVSQVKPFISYFPLPHYCFSREKNRRGNYGHSKSVYFFVPLNILKVTFETTQMHRLIFTVLLPIVVLNYIDEGLLLPFH